MTPLTAKRRKTNQDVTTVKENAAAFTQLPRHADGQKQESRNGILATNSEKRRFDTEDDGPSLSDDESNDASDHSDAENEAAVEPSRPKTNGKRLRSNGRPKRESMVSDAGVKAYAKGTFKSNLFKLQVDELLAQVRPKHGRRAVSAETALHTLKTFIERIPSHGPFAIDEAYRDLIAAKVAVPFPNPRPSSDTKYKFAYSKPTNINVVGSYALKTANRFKDVLVIDLVITMPDSIFEAKDYLNHRYFYKRAYYLACIAANLKTSDLIDFDFSFQLLHDNPLKPILVVAPKEQRTVDSELIPKPEWQIHILPCMNQTQFSPEKLTPGKNCLRNLTAANEAAQHDAPRPTPFYNSSLRSDMLMTAYLKLQHSATKTCDTFVDACLLGSTWLRQRGIDSSIDRGGFGNFEWTALMALGLQGGGLAGRPLLSEKYSSYQLFKATIQLITKRDLTKQSLIFGDNPPMLHASEKGIPQIWDGIRAHNLLFKMSPWSYELLRNEAKTTLDVLNDQSVDGFEATFIVNVQESLYRQDYTLKIPYRVIWDLGQNDGDDNHTILTKLHDVLNLGLKDRVRQITISRPRSDNWDLGSMQPETSQQGYITVGVTVNPDRVASTVDHGPAAEDKAAAAAFRKFWGGKAELRRFKDGSTLESLVWPDLEKGETILIQITRYLLRRHFGEQVEQSLRTFGGDFGSLVRYGTDSTVFSHLLKRYQQLENDLRSLDDLPLAINQIMPADSQLRDASSQPPGRSKQGQKATPADVVIQFEGSGRWPDDLVAIQNTKVAFLLKLRELLQASCEAVAIHVGLEHEDHDIWNQSYLDITYDPDATFRLRIYHGREQTLLERQLKDKTLDPKSRESAAKGLAKYKRDYVKNPAHTQAISRLCSRHQALSGAVRLTKRWFASHLLSNHFADEVIELLVVRSFVQPWPWRAPSSMQTGFLRSLLWISRWDWRTDPLIVDLSENGDLKQVEIQDVMTRFQAWRKLDPAMNRVALFVVSNLDQDGTTWTDGRTEKVVAGRMTALAKSACSEVHNQQLELRPSSLFSSPLSDFDVVFHLARSSEGKNMGQVFKNLELTKFGDNEIPGHDAIRELLTELELLYESAMMFFCGWTERPVIACLWKPQTGLRPWKVNIAYSTVPAKSSDDEKMEATINKAAILAEIAKLGGNLIDKIEVFQH